ncbi:uncharacterized protein LOC106161311 isoform X3 [Lingula anatina]|uniref:Uncharacterized protein LOC106161311 isoform X2 n=1 Tax=Lingula anatina TaxID=7574 RepID=A0A1S3I8G1_LINAN|nr:uncharacterized protein LOC106161311 isoform X2 [Lingula anatina]XP_013393670.1 uncharacterized protein LOC106161311 isoform X3 [Lingula anatina]|eukprot:XP_013393669.1 uncharacterized protein LOC106161311 isoform X2 [Lingula anatina]
MQSFKVTDQGLLFDTRTKAVMAQPAQEGVKEKIQAVREVVPGRSNNEIILVLQYYEYNIDQAIAAFLEDGAKAALQEWHYPGNKAPSKKKKKNKKPQQQQLESGDIQTSAQSSVASVQPLTNGNSQHVTYGPSGKAEPNIQQSQSSGSDKTTKEASPAPQQPRHQRQRRGRTPPSTEAQTANQSSSQSLSDKTVTETSEKQTDRSKVQGQGYVDKGQGEGSVDQHQVPAHPVVAQEKKGGHSDNRPRSRTGSLHKKPEHKVVTTTKTDETGGAHAQGSQLGPQHRPRAGSHHKQHKQQGSHTADHGSGAGHSGQGRISSASARGHRGPHAGLEKSTKDLQRQTISLHRLKEKFSEEMDKDYKHIQSVFEELHKELNEREALLMFEMDKVKQKALDVFSMRQEKAVELKQSTERAQQMNDHQLSDLRADIKMFVSDRKIDENLGSTTRFLCSTDHLVQEVRQFGEVVPVKAIYSTRRPSISSVSSSVVSYDDVLSPTLSVTSPPPVFEGNKDPFPVTQAVKKQHEEDTGMEKAPSAPLLHSDTLTTQELVELQLRLQDSLKKQGLPVHSPPRRAPAPSNQRPTKTQERYDTTETQGDEKKSRNAKRRQKERERQKKRREESQQANQSGIPSGAAPRQQQQNQHKRPASPHKNPTAGGNKKDHSSKPQSENKVQNRRAPSPQKKPSLNPASSPGKQDGGNDKAQHGTHQRDRKSQERQVKKGHGVQPGENKDAKPAQDKVVDVELNADNKTVTAEVSKTEAKVSKTEAEVSDQQGAPPAKENGLDGPNINQDNLMNSTIPAEPTNIVRETNGNVPVKDANMNETTIKDNEAINDIETKVAAENEKDLLTDHDALPQRKPREHTTTKKSTAILNGDIDIVMNGEVHEVNGLDHKD